MAEFNPEVPDQGAPNYTNLSKGAGPDRSGEIAGNGFADIFGGLLKTGDLFVNKSIENDAQYARDSLDNEMGLNAQEYAPGGKGGTGNGPIPDEILQSQNGLQKLSMAQVQGRITPEYYYQRLAATMKGLRARYPGYEQEVDAALTRATGVNPANAFRDALFQNINQTNAQLAAGANNTNKFLEQKSEYGTPDEIQDWQATGGQKYGGPQGLATKWASREAEAKASEARVQAAKNDSALAETNLGQDLSQQTAQLITNINDQSQMGGRSFMEQLSAFGKGEAVSPQQRDSLRGTVQQLINQQTQTATLYAASKYGQVPLDRQRALVQAAIGPLLDIQKQLEQGNFDGAAQTAATVQMTNNQATMYLYKQNPDLATLKSLSDIAPQTADTIVNNLMVQQAGSPNNYFDTVLRKQLLTGAMTGGSIQKLTSDLQSNPNMSEADKQKKIAQLINDFSNAAPQIPQSPDAVRQFVRSNYGVTAQGDVVWQNVQGDQKLLLFNKMFSPEMTKKITASGDAESIATYEKAAVDRFTSVPAFRGAATDITTWAQATQFMNVQYDPNSHRLLITPKREDISREGWFTKDNEAATYRSLKTAVDAFNQGLVSLAPIMKASGIDEQDGVKQLLNQLNVNLEGGKSEGFYSGLAKVLDTATGQNPDADDMGDPDAKNRSGSPDERSQIDRSDVIGDEPLAPDQGVSPESFKIPTEQELRQGGTLQPNKVAASADTLSSITEGAQKIGKNLGVNPQDILTVIGYETGGTFNPWQKGPTTQWGQHRGLIQWGEPQRRAYGVDEDTPVADQMAAVERYLRDAGVRPGASLMDIYSAINAGHVGRNNVSDARNGGAPGTVADKVNFQMGRHKAIAASLLNNSSDTPEDQLP